MPVKSKAQLRYLESKFGHEWVRRHHFVASGSDYVKLPVHVRKKRRRH